MEERERKDVVDGLTTTATASYTSFQNITSRYYEWHRNSSKEQKRKNYRHVLTFSDKTSDLSCFALLF